MMASNILDLSASRYLATPLNISHKPTEDPLNRNAIVYDYSIPISNRLGPNRSDIDSMLDLALEISESLPLVILSDDGDERDHLRMYASTPESVAADPFPPPSRRSRWTSHVGPPPPARPAVLARPREGRVRGR